jgi:hypothetical protein
LSHLGQQGDFVQTVAVVFAQGARAGAAKIRDAFPKQSCFSLAQTVCLNCRGLIKRPLHRFRRGHAPERVFPFARFRLVSVGNVEHETILALPLAWEDNPFCPGLYPSPEYLVPKGQTGTRPSVRLLGID